MVIAIEAHKALVMAGAGRTETHVPSAQDVRAQRLLADIEGLYRARFGAFLRVASGITGDAESGRDAVQEAFARAIRRRADFRGEGSLEGWLWRTVINVAKDHARSARARVLAAELPDVVDPRNAADPGAHPELRARIAALPARQRHALFLRYYADHSYAEIADALAIRVGTVSATLNAAHRALRDTMPEVQAGRHSDRRRAHRARRPSPAR
jgi:RNA polymerase sigma factor (sigma-70 family)